MEEDEYLKLPVEDKCCHKLWKARVSGYEEAVKLFNQWNGDDPNWKKYNSQIKKFITDSNAVAQEKGLEAALAYVENCDTASKVVGDAVEGVVTKCVAAPKAKTKDLAKQIVLMFCEIEQFDKAIEELIKGLAQKNPKVVAGCLNVMTACLNAFGSKVIKASPLVKAAVPTLDHRDKSVREEAKLLIVEAYRWAGDVMKVQLTGLKPVQLGELETEFEKVEKIKPERLIRSQQNRVAVEADSEAVDGGNGDGEDGDDGPDEDPYNDLEAVDVLGRLPKNFYELVEEKKWQLRKEALDALTPLASAPRIAPGDFNDLARVLKKFIGKDTNVLLVASAATILAGLAKGLRSDFRSQASLCLPTVLEKFKEKKANVVAALIQAADGLTAVLGVEAVQEDVLASLKHKTPSVVAETARVLSRAFITIPPSLMSNKKMVKAYVSALNDNGLGHSEKNVRDAASEALGALMKILGEAALTKLLPDLDSIKMAKVKEASEKTVLTGKMPKAEAKRPPPPEVTKKAAVVRKPVVEAKKTEDDFAPKKATAAPGKAAAKKSVASVRGRGVGSVAGRKKSDDIDTGPPYTNTSALKSQRFKDEQKLKLLKWHFSTPRPEFVEQLKEQMIVANFNRTLMTQMFHSDFKQHIKALEMLSKHIDADRDGLVANLDLILKWSTLRFFETNPSVLLKTLEYLNEVFSKLAENESFGLHDIEAASFVPYLVNKVGDPKDQVRTGVRTMFHSLRKVYPVSKLCPYILEGVRVKNAKQRTECLDEIGSIIRQYGLNVLQPSPPQSLKEMAKQIADRDTSVRNAALNAITEAYFQAGETKLYKMIGSLPDRDMAMLEERIKRKSQSRPPTASSAPAAPPAAEPPLSALGLPRPGAGKPSGLRRYQQQTEPKAGLADGGLPRPSEGIPRPSTRPISGAFTLDLDKIESSSGMDGSIGGPQLVNHNLGAIFNDDPVTLPPTLAKRRPVQSGVGPMSPTSRTLIDNSEATDALDVILAQVYNKDASACISALSQLDELIKDEEKVLLLGTRIDQLLTACYMQYRHVLNNKLRTDNVNAKEVMRLFQYLTMVLMSTYHHVELTQNASSSALHDLYNVIIAILLEPRIEQLADGSQLVRALNVLTVKMIDRSDHTNVTCAVIKLLSDVVANHNGSNVKFVEVVMKVMWKITRFLPAWMDDSLDIDSVLAELNDFLKAYPPSFWKKQESDLPFKTVKTALHTMVKVRGDAILDHLTRIADPQSSEVVAYLRKLLNNGIGKENENAKNGNAVSSSSSKFTKSNQEALADIFKKIGQKEMTKIGLQELYNFKQQNPRADLEPFFSKMSAYFRDYIDRGLKSIEADMSAKKILADSNTENVENVDNADVANTHTHYLERLNKLRAKGGLDKNPAVVSTTNKDSTTTTSSTSVYRIAASSSTTVSTNVESDTATPTTTAVPDVDEIRKRLERIKQSAF